eukprot:756732-Hanusia_phi.AAC.7
MSAYDTFGCPETEPEKKYFHADNGRGDSRELQRMLSWLFHVELWTGRNAEIVELVIKEIRNAAALDNSLFFKIVNYRGKSENFALAFSL